MRIAILGTRGIPNHYGGFEQLAEYLSVELARRGHEVTVYNSSLHPYQGNTYQGVNIVHCHDPEHRLGSFGQFIYDLNCIRDSRKRNLDVILQLGYTSSSLWAGLLPAGTRVITNMDGLEWKRSKYNKPVRWFLRQAEKWAVRSSDLLVADSTAIQYYLSRKYRLHSYFIPYGATPFHQADPSVPGSLGLEAFSYYLAMARFEPENNLETVIEGHLLSGDTRPLLLIGSYAGKYGQKLYRRYASEHIRFLGPLYDIEQLNNLRYHSLLYFHGHSVGGTNPSLLEAMASQALICAHDNLFNRAVTGEDAFYFKTSADVEKVIRSLDPEARKAGWIQNNLDKITRQYNWPSVIRAYEDLMKEATGL